MKLKLLISSIILCAFSLALNAQTTYTESAVAYGLNIPHPKNGGHAWADYDKDGDPDVLINLNSTAIRNYLMRNNGDGTFTNVQAVLASGMIATLAERQSAWGDVNNDGRPDFMMNSSGEPEAIAIQIFIQNVDGSFGDGIGGTAPITIGRAGMIVVDPINAEGAGFFDLEGDGDLDVFFDSHNYGIEVLRNNYIDHLTHTVVNPAPNALYTHATPLNGSPNVQLGLNQYATDGDYGTSADVNDDGWVDIFMRKRDQNDFFLNQGGSFTNGSDLSQAQNNNKGANGLWDLDNDGDMDAVWTENGQTQIFRNDGPGIWTALLGTTTFPGLPQPGNFDTGTSSAGIDALAGGDIDNDGDMDILFVGNSRSYLFINQINSPTPAPGVIGSGAAMSFTLDAETFNVGADGEGTTMIDIDDDGDLDIYMNINNAANQLYINNLAAANRVNHLLIDVTEDRYEDGTTGGPGRTAIGTNIIIKDCLGNIISGLRQVNGVYGHGTQIPEEVHIGLPLGENETYLIEVHYPNLYNDAVGGITRLLATAVAEPSTIPGTNHYSLTTTDAENLQNPNAPSAVDDLETVTYGDNISVIINLFTNDSDLDGDSFYLESVVQPALGIVVINDADAGTVTFTYNVPGTPFTGTTFDYTISDATIVCEALGKKDTATVTVFEPCADSGGLDTDGDSINDVCDLDDDGDGILDSIEGPGFDDDVDLDGVPAYLDDNDNNVAIGNDDGLVEAAFDSDGDNISNHLDLDTDNDGLPDNIELQSTNGYIAPAGTVNSNGVNTAYLGGITPEDTDGDGTPDYLDLDSDDEGGNDTAEAALILSGLDTDNDGLDNNIDATVGYSDSNGTINDPTLLPDSDSDLASGGDVDYRDSFNPNPPSSASIDFDGIDDYVEVSTSLINNLDEYTISFWFKPEALPTGAISDYMFIIGQKEMFEISMSNNSGNSFIRARHYYGPGPSAQSIGALIDDQDWWHITAVVNYNTGTIGIYRNGEYGGALNISSNPRLTNSNPFRIGSKRDSQPDPLEENYEGWLDEVRIFDKALNADQIRRMIYQEIENDSSNLHGSVIDKDIDGSLLWTDLVGYYPMTNIVTGRIIDESTNNNVGFLNNISSILPQTAPMPYETKPGGDELWTSEENWLHGDVWDIEDVANNKDWSIVHLHDNLTTTASHTQLGMLIDAGTTLTAGDLALDNQDFELNNTWYLELNGTIDLQDDSQLIQGTDSDLVTSATGKVLRRQEGNTLVHWYNYWSAPIGALGATSLSDNNGPANNANNTPFSLNMLKQADGNNLQFTTELSPPLTNPLTLSTEWFYTFLNGLTYYNWNAIDQTTTILPGQGYIHKGTGAAGLEQQYIFEGKPNNGTILITADDVTDAYEASNGGESIKDVTMITSLIGNPYPSALDARQFIADNSSVISGTIQLWEQWAGSSHYLADYEGGYGYINILTTERAYQDPEIPIADQIQTQGIKRPTFYIPVGQSFIVEVIADTGDIEFNNGQRVFIKESDVMTDQEDPNYANNGSSFLRSANTEASTEDTAAETQILRLEFGVSSGASRSFVLGFTEDATDGYDYGLDGGLILDPPADDMGSLLNDQQYVIQAFAPYTPDKEIDLVLHASGNFTYTLKSTEISNFPVDQDLFIKDVLTGQDYNLRSTEPYNFTSLAGSFTDRFKVIFQDPATLSTEDIANDNILIYVNQIEDKLYVKQLSNQAKKLSITNLLGQSIISYNKIDNQSLENGLNISFLNTGIYIFSITLDNNQTIDKKLIVN